MDIAASEWSNECESGWTVYLEESYIPRTNNIGDYHQSYRLNSTHNDDDGVEDLSMVSDASSGPPHFLHQEVDQQSYSRKSSKKSDKRSKKSSKEHKKVASKQQHHLDDTASSPGITHSKIYDNSSTMDFSENLSATHYQGNSSYNNHHGSFWQSSNVRDDTDNYTQPGQLRRRWE
ncbi:uncharacterized protein LOC110696783 isoform X1 [Chenopodium quinoa]|uniref:uncharacterized protein LOC110696783 isoform X1 n=1 Tax=Chenopodium quinoa TaxID=63459 RepID=UPI000B779866|nr:uncharacterized protein LOC110696783 isoform X1 [Chenopodium quinoa]